MYRFIFALKIAKQQTTKLCVKATEIFWKNIEESNNNYNLFEFNHETHNGWTHAPIHTTTFEVHVKTDRAEG